MKFTDTLTYHGKVTVKTETSSGKVISTQIYKNAGTKYLAKFLCYCIAGNYEIIDGQRPFKIGLFYNSATPKTASGGILTSLTPIYVSANKVADISPVLDATQTTKIVNYKVILHFLIPYSYITHDPDRDEIRQICLYDKVTTKTSSSAASYRDYCASFLLADDDLSDWKPIKIADTGNNSYNLTIDWEMTFGVEE